MNRPNISLSHLTSKLFYIRRDYREKGKEAIKQGDYISAWQHYTDGLQDTPKDPYLWCNRAFTCLKAGYPELAEAYSALGLPKDAAVEYNACIDLVGKDPDYPKSDFKMLEKKKEEHYKTSSLFEQFLQTNGMDPLSTEQPMRHGFYKFDKKYPWDKRYEERTSEESLKQLQQKLDAVSKNLLKVSIVDIDASAQLGIFVKDSISTHRIVFQENPFLPAHNYYVFRCDYCFHELKDLVPTDSYYQPRRVRADREAYTCPKKKCKEVFCSKKCHNLAWNLYHQPLCGKNDDIQEIIDIIRSDKIGVLQYLMLTIRLFAVAIIRDICPLDIEEIKHLSRFTPALTPYKGRMVYDPSLHQIYTTILRILDISKFDLRYDFWIFITVMNMVMPNTYPGPGELEAMDTSVLYPLSSLFNHSCAPNLLDAQYLSQDYDNSAGTIRDSARMLCSINDNDNSYHPARIFFSVLTDIKSDHQAFKSYCNPRHDKVERHAGLATTFGFICKCKRCEFESGESQQYPVNWYFHYSVLPDWAK
ncbi:14861_t:CDS:2 [Funneliformis caledonium]|uniref:14861_t:CDS:1 n=1 Tax=Funneliformis caledonium TaxID=1117310 RepID=A0A9N9CL36_9GLOM|nr:14861_t:CDS:2 [Funneliformis caledonium]